MNRPMSKTAALKAARETCGIVGSGTSYEVFGPHRMSDLRGTSTSVSFPSRRKAVLGLTSWRAAIALYMMGWDARRATVAAESAISQPYPRDGYSLRSIVDEGARQLRREDARAAGIGTA